MLQLLNCSQSTLIGERVESGNTGLVGVVAEVEQEWEKRGRVAALIASSKLLSRKSVRLNLGRNNRPGFGLAWLGPACV